MNIQTRQQADCLIVALQGRLDTTQSEAAERQVNEALASAPAKLIFDCSQMDYISSSGLRIFLIAHKKMTASSGSLRICCLQPSIREIFDMSGFSMIFSMFETLDDALAG